MGPGLGCRTRPGWGGNVWAGLERVGQQSAGHERGQQGTGGGQEEEEDVGGAGTGGHGVSSRVDGGG